MLARARLTARSSGARKSCEHPLPSFIIAAAALPLLYIHTGAASATVYCLLAMHETAIVYMSLSIFLSCNGTSFMFVIILFQRRILWADCSSEGEVALIASIVCSGGVMNAFEVCLYIRASRLGLVKVGNTCITMRLYFVTVRSVYNASVFETTGLLETLLRLF